mgnify:CR=1 FL=1
MGSEIVKTISPETLSRGPYFVVCERCGEINDADTVPFCEGVGSVHVRQTGHTVMIEKREDRG